jgi:hypothetical protein
MNSQKIRYLIPVIILFVSGISFGQRTPDVLLGPLRTENAKTKRLVSEVRTFINSGTTNKAAIRSLGDRLVAGIASNRAIIARYERTSTRFGLQQEYDLVVDMMEDTSLLVRGYGRLTGVSPNPPTPVEQAEARKRTRLFLNKILRPVVAQKLESQGLADVLTAGSFDQAVAAAESNLSDKILGNLNADLRLFVETGVGGGSIKSYAQIAGRRLVARYVATLIAKITTNTLIIDFVGGIIVRWVGATLKRALRPKGNLNARTTRSIKVLESAAFSLNQLEGRNAMSVVRLGLENARSALDSTKYLMGDITRARRADLRARMDTAIGRLNRTIRLTEHRFLIETKMASLDLNAFMRTLNERIAQIRQMQARMVPGARDLIVPPDAPAAKDQVAGRYEGNCVRGCDTRYMGNPDRVQSTYRLDVTGTMNEINFVYRRINEGRVEETVTGHCKWIGGEPGSWRTLKGFGVIKGENRKLEVVIQINRAGNGAWLVKRYYGPFSRTLLHLTKERRGAPR